MAMIIIDDNGVSMMTIMMMVMMMMMMSMMVGVLKRIITTRIKSADVVS